MMKHIYFNMHLTYIKCQKYIYLMIDYILRIDYAGRNLR